MRLPIDDVCCIDETEMHAVLVSRLLFLCYCDPHTQMNTRFGGSF
jgi:hypothetical protein